MQRVVVHWTAGSNRASASDREHYHRLVEYDGTIVKGTEDIADNIVTSDGDYAAHTRNLNSGSIGVAMCGMRGATEYPWSAGPSPLTEKQFRAACILIADLCRQYSIPVTRQTVLTHAEVQPTLGVRQNGKWDITRLPFRADIVGAIPVGDYMRDMVREVLGEQAPAMNRPILRMGSRGYEVMVLQKDLASLGYPVGAADGVFGSGTRGAAVAFQAENGLIADGVVGAQTWAALDRASAKPISAARASATIEDLRAKGSKTIAKADRAEKITKAGTATLVGGVGLDTVLNAAGTLSDAEGLLEAAQRILVENWLVLLVGAAAVLAFMFLPKMLDDIRQTRLRDHQTGRNMGR